MADYILKTRVKKIEEVFDRTWLRGQGKEAEFQTISRGWFVQFEGSLESIRFGAQKPDWQEGDEIAITFRRVENVT